MIEHKIWKGILEPSEEFSPIPFWFFNDMPDEEKIRRQLTDYVEKGVNGFVLHPRIGIPKEIPYLSDAYFDAMRMIIAIADELHMKVVLYDEGMYPSGSAHGMVVAADPTYASRGIIIRENKEAVEETDEMVYSFADGSVLAYGYTKGTIRGVHFGEDDNEEGAPASADILNADAVELFIRLTHDRWYQELKPYFGNTIIGFFTDEPSALGRNAGHFREWIWGLEKEICAAGGNLEDLKAVFFCKKEEQPNETVVIYRKLIKKYLREIFYARLSRWCEAHGIFLMGHPETSDDVEEEYYFQVPGQDLIMRRVSPETGGLLEFDSVQAKLPADIARFFGRRRNANECFGVCNRNWIPWYFTGKDMKWYLNWMGFRGVNLFVPHAFYYSVEGARKEERPPDVGPNNIWWPYYKQVSDYCKRISWLMTDSVNDAKVAVLCDNNRVPYKEVASLYERQITFNYIPTACLKECSVKDGVLYTPNRGQGSYAYTYVLNVLGETYTELKGVREVISSSEIPDACAAVQTATRCLGLRAVRLEKDSTVLYLLSNESEETIETEITLKAKKTFTMADLWNGTMQTCVGRMDEDSVKINICIEPCEMLLLMEELSESDACKEEAKTCVKQKNRYGTLLPIGEKKMLPDWTERFLLCKRGNNQAEYEYLYETKEKDTIAFEVYGEEMAECFCNGQLVGASLYSPHRFVIPAAFVEDKNKIKLCMTGSAANQYEQAGIAYGLEHDKKADH